MVAQTLLEAQKRWASKPLHRRSCELLSGRPEVSPGAVMIPSSYRKKDRCAPPAPTLPACEGQSCARTSPMGQGPCAMPPEALRAAAPTPDRPVRHSLDPAQSQEARPKALRAVAKEWSRRTLSVLYALKLDQIAHVRSDLQATATGRRPGWRWRPTICNAPPDLITQSERQTEHAKAAPPGLVETRDRQGDCELLARLRGR